MMFLFSHKNIMILNRLVNTFNKMVGLYTFIEILILNSNYIIFSI
jgi:hypothetical protein